MNNDFWAEFTSLLNPASVEELEYRLHYNELGEITLCTMSDHPDSTQYLVVDKETYDNYFRYLIIKGQLVKIEHDSQYRARLKKSTTGFPTVAGHAGLVIEENEVYNNIEYYEPNN